MRPTLAIVGCGPRLEVALGTATAPPGAVALAGPTPRSDLVMTAVELLMKAADLQPNDLGAVVATRGPGSFTGIRVALATARGLATALGIPGFGLPSLVAQAARTTLERCFAAQPARRGHLYVQEFRRSAPGDVPEPVGEVRMAALADLAALELPVIAPTGVELPPGSPSAPAAASTAEAVLLLAAALSETDDTLSPIYLEPPPAVPPTRTAKPWPPSPTAS